MKKESPGFIKILVLLIVVVAGLLISGIDLRELIADFDIQETTVNAWTRAQTIYSAHLAEPMQQFIIDPAISVYTFVKIQIIDEIVHFIERIL